MWTYRANATSVNEYKYIAIVASRPMYQFARKGEFCNKATLVFVVEPLVN